MMSQVASVSSEGIEWISSSLGNMGRERKLPTAAKSARFEKLLGFAPSSHSSFVESDLSDLKEEDVWGDDSWISEAGRKEESRRSGARDGLENYRTISNHRRWSAERDSGFSLAIDSGRTRGLSSLSPFSSLTLAETSTPQKIHHSSVIPNDGNHRGFLQSAPVKVPHWSKVSKEDKEDDYEERLPPHEMLAREYAKSQTTPFSVIEGAGRTLKGRDLSKVRNTVWKQTGFFG